MSQTFLFYDIESTGLNKAFDQVVQFAAIRTDLTCNELERHEYLVKLNKDTIPSPQAMITHRVGIKALENGINEFEAMQHIHQHLNTPGTISIGYNTLGFDDEFLRFSFYRNLLTPYTHQYTNNCSRADLYPITLLFYLFHPDALKWPKIDGKVSLKLEKLSELNLLATGQAHNAMVDVEATVALAKQLMQKAEPWTYALDFFNKNTDIKRSSQLQQALFISGKLGAKQQFQSWVLSLGQHRDYTNQSLWLRLDCEDLLEATPENFEEKSWVINKKWGEPGFLLPVKDRFLAEWTPDRRSIVKENLAFLAKNPSLLETIRLFYQEKTYPEVAFIDPSANLYAGGFLSDAEQRQCRAFHQGNPIDKLKIYESFQQNSTLHALAERILARHYPEHCPDSLLQRFDNYCVALQTAESCEKIRDYRDNPHLDTETVLNEINKLIDSPLDDQQQKILQDLKIYLHN